MKNIRSDPSSLLNDCEGDYDFDMDCKSGQCFQKGSSNNPTPPGCRNTPKNAWDYCATKSSLKNISLDPSGLFFNCEGDCDSDMECKSGKCFQRGSNGDPTPFGCCGTTKNA